MVLGTLGKREGEDGRGTSTLDATERPLVKRQARAVIVKSVVIAAIVAAVVMAVPG
ncbi:MAG TPA: hypothetical protein VHB25_03865 [Gemmatimonadaceae bacterium]|nr:hypothetical protein [Gemmatimonadaceae bacterium]